MDFLAKHWGDVASVLGLALAIWFAYQAKTAAEQARDAAREARNRVSTLDTISELSSAITILQEITRLQRTGAWETDRTVVLDRYGDARVRLVRCERGIGVGAADRALINSAIAHLVIIVEEIERGITNPERAQLDVVRFNRTISSQIDAHSREFGWA